MGDEETVSGPVEGDARQRWSDASGRDDPAEHREARLRRCRGLLFPVRVADRGEHEQCSQAAQQREDQEEGIFPGGPAQKKSRERACGESQVNGRVVEPHDLSPHVGKEGGEQRRPQCPDGHFSRSLEKAPREEEGQGRAAPVEQSRAGAEEVSSGEKGLETPPVGEHAHGNLECHIGNSEGGGEIAHGMGGPGGDHGFSGKNGHDHAHAEHEQQCGGDEPHERCDAGHDDQLLVSTTKEHPEVPHRNSGTRRTRGGDRPALEGKRKEKRRRYDQEHTTNSSRGETPGNPCRRKHCGPSSSFGEMKRPEDQTRLFRRYSVRVAVMPFGGGGEGRNGVRLMEFSFFPCFGKAVAAVPRSFGKNFRRKEQSPSAFAPVPSVVIPLPRSFPADARGNHSFPSRSTFAEKPFCTGVSVAVSQQRFSATR